MTVRRATAALLVCLAGSLMMLAQDPTGILEGQVTDRTAGAVSGTLVSAKNLDSGWASESLTASTGLFRLPLLPVGRYQLAINVSYWFSKSLDYFSAMNLSGAAAKSLTGENDLAQNPFDLAAEHGPSLFDAHHRFVASLSYEPHFARNATPVVRAMFDGWQVNFISTHNSATPFTVGDSTNVSLQANDPPISGFYARRPDLIGNPNDGPQTVQQWLDPSAFLRLNPQTQAGQFGNEGRNVARGPAFTDVDVSLTRLFRITEGTHLQFRAESCNVANHPNFGLPVADLNSPNFGQNFTAAPPRLIQFALKLMF